MAWPWRRPARRRGGWAPPGARAIAVTLSALGLTLLLSTCGGERQPRVLVLGLDGVDPRVVDLLMSEGKLPSFARLRQQGAYAPLRSRKPLLSPVVWTTIATGRLPEQHGIGHFVTVNAATGGQLPVTSTMRRVRALWNIFSEADRTVEVVGWWATWPPEEVKGVVVSDHLCYHFLLEGTESPEVGAAVTHPAALEAEIAPHVVRPGDLGLERLSRYARVSAADLARPFSFEDPLGHLRWALATADSYGRIGLDLWRTRRPELAMVYVEAPDTTSHLFGHLFRVEGLAGELLEQQRQYGDTVEQVYWLADEIVGRYIDAMDDRTTLLVMSDHGFQVGQLPDDPSTTRDMRRVSEYYHAEEGILYMYGRGVKRHARIDAPTIVDVAPTILALAGLPAARDMPGRVLVEALVDVGVPERIATYERGERAVASPAGGAAPGDAVDPEILEKLRSLGYLGDSSPRADRNLAALHFQAGRYDEAIAEYRRLIEGAPDDSALHASLSGVLGAAGRLDEALVEARAAIELDPLDVEAYHNLGALLERRGEVAEAVDAYRKAVKYNPRYEPSRKALARLTGSPTGAEPPTGADARATALAEQASQLARRGDYAGALARLDEAGQLAPRLALVAQYRSNVAYLMGDMVGARRALERALELEPDNALFRENLRRLEGK